MLLLAKLGGLAGSGTSPTFDHLPHALRTQRTLKGFRVHIPYRDS